MKEYISILSAAGKIPLGLYPGLLAANMVFLFAPESIAERLFITKLRSDHGHVAGVIFLVLVAVNIWLLVDMLMSRHRAKVRRRARLDSLGSLTAEEKGYLRSFIDEGRNTIRVQVGDGVAGGLEVKQILYPSASTFSVLDGMPFNLQPWARQHLQEHPELLDGAIGRPLSPRDHLNNGFGAGV